MSLLTIGGFNYNNSNSSYNNSYNSNNNGPLSDITNIIIEEKEEKEEKYHHGIIETPRNTNEKYKVTFAPKKNNNNFDNITQNNNSYNNNNNNNNTNNNKDNINILTTSKRLQFEDENTLQSIIKPNNRSYNYNQNNNYVNEDMSPPDNIHDRSRCARKKFNNNNNNNNNNSNNNNKNNKNNSSEQTQSTPQKKIPLLYGANITVESPDPLSKYNSEVQGRFRINNLTSLSRVLHETKVEQNSSIYQSPDSVVDDIYDFSNTKSTTTSSTSTSTSKYKRSSISEVIRGTFNEECDAEHNANLNNNSNNNSNNNEYSIAPKNSTEDEEEKLFQQMMAHRKKKTIKSSLQPINASNNNNIDNNNNNNNNSTIIRNNDSDTYFIPKPSNIRTGGQINSIYLSKSIDSAISSTYDNNNNSTNNIHSTNNNKNEISKSFESFYSSPSLTMSSPSSTIIDYTSVRPSPPSEPPNNSTIRKYSRPIPPSSPSLQNSSISISSPSPSSSSSNFLSSSIQSPSLTPLSTINENSDSPEQSNSPTNNNNSNSNSGRSRPLCGRKYSMAPKNKIHIENNSPNTLEDSLESFTIPKVDSNKDILTTTSSITSTTSITTTVPTKSATQTIVKSTPFNRKVVTSGCSKQVMQYLLLQANKKRRKRGKSSNGPFTPKFESIPEDSIIIFPSTIISNIRVENNMTIPPIIPPEYISWMIDEYMTDNDENEEEEYKSILEDCFDYNNDNNYNDNNYDDENENENESNKRNNELNNEERIEKLLFYSIKNYNTKLFKEILEFHPEAINYRDNKGNTPLILSTIVGWRKGIKILLKLGSNINAQNNKGNTCCHYAFILSNYSDIQRYFIRKKADLKIVNERFYTCKYHYCNPYNNNQKNNNYNSNSNSTNYNINNNNNDDNNDDDDNNNYESF